MLQNFACSVTNLREGRYWTVLTCAFSHKEVSHLMGNLAALWLFGFHVFRSLGVFPRTRIPRFYALYALGGTMSALGQVLLGYSRGDVLPAFTSAQQRAVEHMLADAQAMLGPYEDLTESTLPFYLRQILDHRDKPMLGASGSVMATCAAAGCLFPTDQVFLRFAYFPLTVVCFTYILGDVCGLVIPGKCWMFCPYHLSIMTFVGSSRI